MQADPDTQVEVDLMILDYLACVAIDRSLAAIESQDPQCADESEWHAQITTAFQSLVARHGSLPEDLDVKLQILTIANHLRHHAPARPGRSNTHTTQIPLSGIGIEFMDLCSSASFKVSETRWFDLGARILTHAALEEKAEGRSPSQDLNKLYQWTANDRAHQDKWEKVRSQHIDQLPVNRTIETQFLDRGLSTLTAILVQFLLDLMGTLDQPILIQLERGQLGDLSAVETQRLKERAGLS
ncbi:hypothetical protein N7492_007846 [Penicillium capsulatum]|uniref:Uncharacterized protein n=1 Tax=Penicillium capsulatum TaxID=69766 RepID=A0A9W9LM26_9EURO|nr:hypothetical protein N7492_007846 [Penicillium capsulatum]KAJ6117677.1 hypothetical protein N7512_007402 [Penicillium capsulatum]